ncbi:MAG TPA: hypothetical protein VG649_08285 [Candidatus Angelobacter sp.]|jgi:hypothetical protein|nr:hypothetical protein [Candidatus Angelobacter sp.]
MNQSGTRAIHSALRIGDPHISDEYHGTHNSGETVLLSGIYKAAHRAINGKHAGEVVVIKGSQFPNCSCCGASLEFCLLQSAMHISEDEDFMNFAFS